MGRMGNSSQYSLALIMKLVVITAALLGAVLASKDAVHAYRNLQFASFREQHGKQYSSKAELELRRDIFHANLVKIERHNALGSWKMGVNEFSDLTQAEFEAQMTGGYKMMPQSGAAAPASTFKAKSRSELPDSVDWRDHSAVSEVKNKGQCGSCWAFCTTEMIESYAAIETGTLPELSTLSHVEALEAAMDPSLSLVTLTSSCSATFPRLTTLTPLDPPLRLETACTTSPTPPPLLESLATTLLPPTTRMPS